MGSYKFNRASFKAPSSGSLARAYCTLVCIELALKEALGYLESSNNGGHDVPTLLSAYIEVNKDKVDATIQTDLKARMSELRSAYDDIYCQGKKGTPQSLPYTSYPNMRYTRHAQDSWAGSFSGDLEIERLATVANGIYSLLKRTGIIE